MTSQVKIIRQKLLMTQGELAKQLGISKQMISNYETGLYSPSMKVIKKIMVIARENQIEINAEDFFK